MEDRMKLSLSPKLVGKLVWVIVISPCKIFIPSYTFDGLLCQYWLLLLPPNHRTLWELHWSYQTVVVGTWQSHGGMLMVATTNQKCWSQVPTRHVCKSFEDHWPMCSVFHLDFFGFVVFFLGLKCAFLCLLICCWICNPLWPYLLVSGLSICFQVVDLFS